MVNKYSSTGIVVLVLLFFDQLTKYFVRVNTLDVEIIKNFFSLSFIKNTGAGFGILKGYLPLIITINIIALIALIFFFIYAKKSFLADISIVLIVTGAIGNLIDRILFGYVTDFIYFHFFPAFNIADSCVTVGGIILGYCLIFGKFD